MKTALLVAGLVALAALGGGLAALQSDSNSDTTGLVHARLARTEAANSGAGQLLRAMRTKQPALYKKFVLYVVEEAAAGDHRFNIAPLLLPVVSMEAATANDKEIGAYLDMLIAQMKQPPVNGAACAGPDNLNGEADKLSKWVVDARLRLAAHIMSTDAHGTERATAEEMETWATALFQNHPDIARAAQMQKPPKDLQCAGALTTLEALASEPLDKRGRLFRTQAAGPAS